MNEWFKRLIANIKRLWGNWSSTQKIIFFGVIGVALLGIILLVSFSAQPGMVPLLYRSIQDEEELNSILVRLDEEGVEYQVTADNRILVADERVAQRMRSVLTREDLIPAGTDPWELFDVDRWTVTDFERNVNLQRAIVRELEQHITALDSVDAASVSLAIPEDELFAEDQDPVTASVVITPAPGADLAENRKTLQGIERLIQFAVEGLQAENIIITNHQGVQLNDFAGMEDFDRINLTKREMALKREYEQGLIRNIEKALGNILKPDRVVVPNINVEIDMSKVTEDVEEHFPITLVPDNPRTPYSELEVIPNVPISQEIFEESYQGPGFNPEGPPGQEGQTPPAYRDLEMGTGTYDRDNVITNYEINTRLISRVKSPVVDRVTVSVAVDGKWRWVYNEEGDPVVNPDGSIEREYIPVTDEQLETFEALVRDAVGYSTERGDSVTVAHVPFDRSEEHLLEDEAYARRRQMQMIILYVLIGVAVLLVAFIAFRLISREVERRRRLREEELARQHQAMREAALRSAEEESAEVAMSVEERARMEMQENAINMAREHPEDVAQLIRTWLMEE
jgi:flagellar M-ring protein FliF